jgi:hypothetical protein
MGFPEERTEGLERGSAKQSFVPGHLIVDSHRGDASEHVAITEGFAIFAFEMKGAHHGRDWYGAAYLGHHLVAANRQYVAHFAAEQGRVNFQYQQTFVFAKEKVGDAGQLFLIAGEYKTLGKVFNRGVSALGRCFLPVFVEGDVEQQFAHTGTRRQLGIKDVARLPELPAKSCLMPPV